MKTMFGSFQSMNKTLRRTALIALLCCALTPLTFDSAYSRQTQTPAQQQQRPRRAKQKSATDAGGAKSSGEQVGDDDVVRVDTQLVSVPVTVRNREGRPVANLRQQDFQIFENNQLQRIFSFSQTDAPFEVALLLDTSGSTRADIALIRRAANDFIDALRPGDRVAIVSFNSKTDETAFGAGGAAAAATVEVKTKLTDNRNALHDAIETLGASAGTPYYDSLERIAKEVFRDPPSEQFRGRRAVVALTDGVDSTSDAEFADVRERLLRAGVVCYFVEINTEEFVEERLLKDCAGDGRLTLSRAQLERYRRLFAPQTDAGDYASFCRLGQFEKMDISRKLYELARQEMRGLARETGGATFAAADLRDARRAFAQVAREIGTQYSISYYPTNKARDGSFRKISVVVKNAPGYEVRAREGYQAPKS